MTATLCLLAAGAVMVYSASSAKTVVAAHGGDGAAYLIKYVGFACVGFVLMHLISRHGLKYVAQFTVPLLCVCLVLQALVLVPGIGVEVNGSRRWLGAGPLQFQPAELLKFALVLHAVRMLAMKPKIVASPRLLVPLAAVALFGIGLVAAKDLGTALVMAFALCALLVAAGMPLRYLAAIAAAGGCVVLILALIEPYRLQRLTSFMDPWADAQDSGHQAVQGQIALGSGGFFGRGLGESVQKVYYLPEAHTDFILAIIGEELGVFGVTVLLFLYGLIAYAGLRIAQGAQGAYGKLLAAGLTSMIICQAMLNTFTVLGMVPLTGVPLPFISYGSTNLIMLLMSMGLLMNIAQGGVVHVRALPGSASDGTSVDSRRRDSRPRGARAGGRRRATG
ncbi:putative lipid II flippase FtsW [Paraconexibacter sp. AEG42_29]